MEWLRTYHAQHFLDHPVICFVNQQEYPFLFFSLFLRRLAKDYSAITHYNIQQNDTLYAQLETSFLGLPRICWLGSLDILSKEQSEKWQRYISTYNGPNYILYVISGESKSELSHKVVHIKEEQVSKKDFSLLFDFFVRPVKSSDLERIDHIYAKTGPMSLDAACLLLQYLQVTGYKDQEFFNSWLRWLVIPQQSLFSLSQYFFAKDRAAFFNAWAAVKNSYAEQFWIAFFSEQLWRASFYCKYMQESKWNEAKAIGYRLPFSFLQKDYKKLTFQELCNAHNWLYQCDYDIKNGVHADRLELFFYHFFANYYQKMTC